MKLRLISPLIVKSIIILLGMSMTRLLTPITKAQAIGFLQLPFHEAPGYRINSYVDHDLPQFNNRDGLLLFFNGERYGDCPASGSSWIEGDGQGPYCYDSHSGIDWAMEKNTSILAAAAGQISEIGFDVDATGKGYGRFIRIEHGNGYDTLYAHLTTVSAQVGDDVNVGDEIGRSGNSGTVEYHLHFEVQYTDNERATDPFGWRGNTPDPLISYSGEAAVCLWANRWCHETIVEDGDINQEGTIIKFAQFGSGWQWLSQGNSWTMKYVTSGEGSTFAYWIPYLRHPSPYEVLAFIPDSSNKTSVSYTIHDQNGQYHYTVNQADSTNQWVSLGSYTFGSGANNYVKLSNDTGSQSGQRVVFDTIKFRQFRAFLPLIWQDNK